MSKRAALWTLGLAVIGMQTASADSCEFSARRAVDVDESAVGKVMISSELEDSSGDLKLSHVRSAVVTDSSGDIIAQQVQHNVTIDTDSSGSIRVEEIGGSFTVGTDSSGGIRHASVLGPNTAAAASGLTGVRRGKIVRRALVSA